MDCDADDNACNSYLMTGGLALTTPWPPVSHVEDPVILVESVPGTQIDFRRGLQRGDYIEEDDCDLFYQEPYLIAIRFCLTRSRVRPGSFIAGKSTAADIM